MSPTQRKRVIDAIPSNWLDPLLTGPTAVVGKPPYNCEHVEAILNAVRARVTAALPKPPRRAKR